MLLTPKFSISQDEEFLHLRINLPYVKVSDTELVLEGKDFSFYCRPYLLKLTFPHEVCDEEDSYSAKYDPEEEHGLLKIKLRKRETGLHFPDLDLISTLMIKRNVEKLVKTTDNGASIEVLHSETFTDDAEDDRSSETNIMGRGELKRIYPYGFNQAYDHVLDSLSENMYDMIEIKQPKVYDLVQRRIQRIECENMLFSPHRYLGDYFDGESDYLFSSFLSYNPFWFDMWNLRSKSSKDGKQDLFESVGGFSESESSTLVAISTRSKVPETYPQQDKQSLLYGLVDLLFSICYEYRLCSGEFSAESCHNISRLSATLSWLECYRSEYFAKNDSFIPETNPNSVEVRDILTVVRFSFRRLCIYPYLRHWKLGRKVLTDIVKLLLLGKRPILKLFLQLYDLFQHTDSHYLLNTLYVKDYCLFLQQSVTDAELYRFGNQVNQAKTIFEKNLELSKQSMGFFLPEIESWAMNEVSKSEEENSDDSFLQSIPIEYCDYSKGIETNPLLCYLLPASTITLPQEEQESKLVLNLLNEEKTTTTRGKPESNSDLLQEVVTRRKNPSPKEKSMIEVSEVTKDLSQVSLHEK